MKGLISVFTLVFFLVLMGCGNLGKMEKAKYNQQIEELQSQISSLQGKAQDLEGRVQSFLTLLSVSQMEKKDLAEKNQKLLKQIEVHERNFAQRKKADVELLAAVKKWNLQIQRGN